MLVQNINELAEREYDFDVAMGRVPNVTAFRKFGRNNGLGASDEVISMTGASLPYMPSAAVKVNVTAANPADDAAGAGARSIVIVGLDGNFNEVSETIALTGGGTTGDSQFSYLRIYRAYIGGVGTYGAANTGLLTVLGTGGGTTFVVIPAGLGQTQTSHYCVPANYTLYVYDVHISVNSGKYADLTWFQRIKADQTAAPFGALRIINTYDGVVGTVDLTYSVPIKFDQRTDVYFIGNAGAGGGAASVEYSGYLVKGVS